MSGPPFWIQEVRRESLPLFLPKLQSHGLSGWAPNAGRPPYCGNDSRLNAATKRRR
jgi:hypothetical protein